TSYALFALLQSSLHLVFAWQHASRLKGDLRYAPSDCLETFPFPETVNDNDTLQQLGERYHERRRTLMRGLNIGLTDLYRRIHDPNDNDPIVEELRVLHRNVDVGVAGAYGWGALKLDHSLHEVPYLPENDRVRFTISEAARVEVLRR